MTETRKSHTHLSKTQVTLEIRWCVRCSGWEYVRRLAERESSWVGYGASTYMEGHFLEAEETSPDILALLLGRAMRAAQEAEQDARNN